MVITDGYKLGDTAQRKKVGLKGGQLVRLMQCSECEVIKWANKNYIEPYMCNRCSCKNRRMNVNLNTFIHKPNCKCRKCRTINGYYKGKDNPMWKGGKRNHKDGYIYQWVADDDPMKCMCTKLTKSQNYVLEHRLVMARKIGRPLLKNETVHHLNGIRNDNREENLELWSSNHQSGQRINDQIKNSIELLKTYGYKITQNGK